MKRLLLIFSSLSGTIQPSFEFSQPAIVSSCFEQRVSANKHPPAGPVSPRPLRLRYRPRSPTSSSSGKQRAAKDDSLPEPRHDPTVEGGMVYYGTSVLPLSDFDRLLEEVRGMLSTTRLCEERATSVATNRQGVALSDHSPLIPLLDRSLSTWIPRQLHKQQRHVRRHPGACPSSPDGTLTRASHAAYVLSPDVPVELRVYQWPGAAMAWHVDDVLYDPPQLEVVVTLENTSDCVTLWKPSASSSSSSVKSASAVRAIETDPNSALLLVAGGAPHCVTALTRGKRTIVKLVYVRPGAIYMGSTTATADSQFAPMPRQSKKTKKRQQRKSGRK